MDARAATTPPVPVGQRVGLVLVSHPPRTLVRPTRRVERGTPAAGVRWGGRTTSTGADR
ncbi:hypothetical protein EDD33_0949 [Nocardioides aurantiacus]|uniref:Uncharacterized protein n=2 Tax=Nocardioides aurantiacus TaxID=86796 RepID=A0A3N2CS92_9ACTN|nr:hypothetical protein EDD33_0949 [Nocardioides aurantiacus]